MSSRTSRRFRIRGMDCVEETSALKRTVGTLPGVSGLDCDLIDGPMTEGSAVRE